MKTIVHKVEIFASHGALRGYNIPVGVVVSLTFQIWPYPKIFFQILFPFL